MTSIERAFSDLLQNEMSQKEFHDLLKEKCINLDKLISSTKSSANLCFKQGKYKEAADLYTSCTLALDVNNKDEVGNLYANRSACYFKLNKRTACLSDAIIALQNRPTYFKCWLRLADAYSLYNNLRSCVVALESAIKYADNPTYKQILREKLNETKLALFKQNNALKYKTDYSKFTKLIEREEEQEKINSSSDSLKIELKKELSPEQQEALETSLLGKPTKKTKVKDYSFKLATTFDGSGNGVNPQIAECAKKFIEIFTQIHCKRSFSDRYFDLFNSEIEFQYCQSAINRVKAFKEKNNCVAKICLFGCGSIILPFELAKMGVDLQIVVNENDSLVETTFLTEAFDKFNLKVEITKLSSKDINLPNNDTQYTIENADTDSQQIFDQGLDVYMSEKCKSRLKDEKFDFVIVDPDLLDCFVLNPYYKLDIFSVNVTAKHFIPGRIDVVASVAELDLSNYLLVNQPWCLAPIAYDERSMVIKNSSSNIKIFSFYPIQCARSHEELQKLLSSNSSEFDVTSCGSSSIDFKPNSVILSYQLYDDNGMLYDSFEDSLKTSFHKTRSSYVLLLRGCTNSQISDLNESYLRLKTNTRTFISADLCLNSSLYTSRYLPDDKSMPNIFPSIQRGMSELINNLFYGACKQYANKLHSCITASQQASINILFFDCRTYNDLQSVISAFITTPRSMSSKFATTHYKIYCCSTNSLSEIALELDKNIDVVAKNTIEKSKNNSGLKWINGKNNVVQEAENDEHLVDKAKSLIKKAVTFCKTYIYETVPANETVVKSSQYQESRQLLFNTSAPITDDIKTFKIDDSIDICFLGGPYYVSLEFDPFRTDLLYQALYVRSAFRKQKPCLICPGIVKLYAMPYSANNIFINDLLQHNKRINNVDIMKHITLLTTEPDFLLSVDLNTVTKYRISEIAKTQIIKSYDNKDNNVDGIICFASYSFGINENMITLSHAPNCVSLGQNEYRFDFPQQIILPLAKSGKSTTDVMISFPNARAINATLSDFTVFKNSFPMANQILTNYGLILSKLDSEFYTSTLSGIKVLPAMQKAFATFAEQGLSHGMDYAAFDQVFTYVHTFAS